MFLVVKIRDLISDGFEHSRFSAFVGNTEYTAKLFVEIRNTDGGPARILHMVHVWVKALGEAAQRGSEVRVNA